MKDRKDGGKKEKFPHRMWIKAAGIVLGACLCFGLGVILFVITNRDTKIQKEENSSQAQTVEQQAVPAVKEEQKEMESDTGVKMEKAVVPEKIVKTKDSLYTYEEMKEDLNALSEYFPDQITVRSLGVTADKREIPEVILGDPDSDCHLLIQASIHGREYMNTQILMCQLEDFLRNYENGIYEGMTYRDLLNGLCLHLIPMANPDGVTISQMGLDGIQTEECRAFLQQCYESDQADGVDMSEYWSSWKANARGVDLNRNFDIGWEEFAGCEHPSSERFQGEAPASEAAVQAILQIQEEYPVKGCIAYHSSGSLVYWDYGSEGAVYEQDRLLAQMAGEVTGYALHSTVADGTDLAGCSDYFVLQLGIPAVTIENGTGRCPLSVEELPDLLERNQELILAYLQLYQQ